ncbi:MAG: rod shape-determining protein MreD [Cyanosarcina radialis HA8281-LM2]|jgi:rod shape-determining protein MreD|nr:rod shape-determining protein MreD [Cyanosarcina radialis HA8281-LM2]
MIKISDLSPRTRQILGWLVTVGSAFLCLLLLLTRWPGMELLGIGPNWLLIWVAIWSLKRTVFQGAIAGLALGMIQDGMTSLYPTHTLSLILVGVLSARIQKQRYIQEDFISIALIVFGLSILAETVTAIQYILPGDVASLGLEYPTRTWSETWLDYQRIALCSAILSSLWSPVLYYPLTSWWEQTNSEQYYD